MAILSLFGWLLLALAAIGTAYMLGAAATIVRFFAAARPAVRSDVAVTILKPLHGTEPRLTDNLATFLAQDHGGAIQLLCGVQHEGDSAIQRVEDLRQLKPDARIDLIVDPTPHGSNGKVANLINLEPHIAHDVVVLSDSDMAVPPDYLARLLASLERPGVGVVTCLYRGRGDAGFWSRLGAAGLSYQFLPNATFATAIGQIGDACMGSTIALRRETLEAVGGFAAFADILADDHALGKKVRAQGLDVVIPPMLLTHASDETGFGALWPHELRWAATVRSLTPALAYAGSLITFPVPLAIIGALFHPAAGFALAIVALVTRIVVAGAVDTVAGASTVSKWLLPARDFLSLAIFVASYAARSVDWRGTRLTMGSDGRIAAETESQDR
jgi:ceramide glucosyltransferase